ncbi:MAG: hypothetical protein ACK41W_08900 [Cyanobacteriota bacterium]
MSIDKNDRRRGGDEGDAPWLGNGDVAPGDGEVVMGGEEGDQAKGKATDGLGEAEAVETELTKTEMAWARPRGSCCW